MATKTIYSVKLQFVTNTTEQWAEITQVVSKGVPCVEFTADGKTKFKIGDGVKTYAELPYVGSDELTSTAIANALGFTPLNEAKAGIADGIATLDASGKIPTSQLPSYVSDVIEADSAEDFPEEGESAKIYVAIDTGKVYRWSGSGYVVISDSIIVTASENNGYIKVNGTDLKVYEAVQADWAEENETAPSFIKNKPVIPEGAVVDEELDDESTNAVQNKVITAALNDKIDVNDTLILNCVL